jgi:hypothetical protein
MQVYHNDNDERTPDQLHWQRLAVLAQAGSRAAAREMTALLAKLAANAVHYPQESETPR